MEQGNKNRKLQIKIEKQQFIKQLRNKLSWNIGKLSEFQKNF